MDNLEYLKPYVLTGTAEGDKGFLNNLFIMPENLSNIIALPSGMSILIGHKGIGKSALMNQLYQGNQFAGVHSIFMKPDSIAKKISISGNNSLAELKSTFFDALIESIIEEISKDLPKFIKKDSDKELYNYLKNHGKVDSDFIQKSLNFLSIIATPTTSIDFEKIITSLTKKNTSSLDGLLNAINIRIKNERENIFYIFIDDTDQVMISSDDKELNKIWGLLQAIRELTIKCPSVRVIISLRTSIWSRMNEESSIIQNEQMDHFRSYQVNLHVSDKLIKDIYEARLIAAKVELNKHIHRQYTDEYDAFFENKDVKLPTSQERRYWRDFIVKSARNRPRDAIQLIRHLIENAQKRRTARLDELSLLTEKQSKEKNTPLRITDADVDLAMNTYSEERLEDISKEYVADCSQTRDILHRFSSHNFEWDFDDLFKFLQGMPGGLLIELRGEKLGSENKEHAIKLLKYLHEIGFINPKIINKDKPEFKHILFEQNRNFVSKGNIEQMRKCKWEIHPAFRSALIAHKNMLSL
ncbi:P-loop ATPase, Sll1717 family [Neisseria cinerea]|uniref:P-loop ATPase, Sll1717 family n=2 Tax=Neisseria TaxID=482 RepID=UPI003989E60D